MHQPCALYVCVAAENESLYDCVHDPGDQSECYASKYEECKLKVKAVTHVQYIVEE